LTLERRTPPRKAGDEDLFALSNEGKNKLKELSRSEFKELSSAFPQTLVYGSFAPPGGLRQSSGIANNASAGSE